MLPPDCETRRAENFFLNRGKPAQARMSAPFDRMLIAQAQLEGMTLVTVDPLIQRYAQSVLC